MYNYSSRSKWEVQKLIREALFELIKLFSISLFSSHRSKKIITLKKNRTPLKTHFLLKRKGRGKKKKKERSHPLFGPSLLFTEVQCQTRRDTERGCPCLRRVSASPARFPSAQGPPPSSGSSSCTQVGAGAATEKPEQLPRLRNEPLPPR